MACIEPYADFDAVEDAKALEKAMKGLGRYTKKMLMNFKHVWSFNIPIE